MFVFSISRESGSENSSQSRSTSFGTRITVTSLPEQSVSQLMLKISICELLLK